MTTTYGDRFNVTLDWVELFEGLPLDESTGRLKTTDSDGNFKTNKLKQSNLLYLNR